MQQLLAILGSLGFVGLGLAMLRYMDAPPVVAWATIGFFGLGAIWMIVRLIYNRVTHKAQPEFVDLELPMAEFTEDGAGEFQVTALGQARGRRMGFAVRVEPHWDAQPRAGYTLYAGTVVLRAIGDASDVFVCYLAERYQLELSTRHMVPEIVVQAVGLDFDPRAIAQRPVKMKLFFHAEVEDRYAEVFLNIDRAEQVVQVREKDLDYRGNILRALTEVVPDAARVSGQGSEVG